MLRDRLAGQLSRPNNPAKLLHTGLLVLPNLLRVWSRPRQHRLHLLHHARVRHRSDSYFNVPVDELRHSYYTEEVQGEKALLP